MEGLTTAVFEKTQFLSRISALRANPSFSNQRKKGPSRCYTRFSSFPVTYSFRSFSTFSNCHKLEISAHLGGPSKRRNSLRKKLIEEQQVRRFPDSFDRTSDIHNLNYDFDDIDNLPSNLNNGNLNGDRPASGEGDVIDTTTVEKSKLLDDSVLRSKLNNWVDQYKRDAEFWGIGSSPIFTVFQDLEGNIERVSVHEDEILRRSRVRASSLRQQEFGDDFMDVNSKINHAKSLAKKIEMGEYMLPDNSSVAKFVVSGRQSGFLEGFRSVALQPHLFMKLSRIGFVMSCGFLVFWVTKRLFTVRHDEADLTREEKEMLRRKMKSRMEKEKMEKGSVEVLPENAEPLMDSIERPRLDKKGLMESISKARATDDIVISHDSSSALSAKSVILDAKIQEIREMARHARELEQGPPLPDGDDEDNEAGKELLNEMEGIKTKEEVGPNFLKSEGDLGQMIGSKLPASFDDQKTDDSGFLGQISSAENIGAQILSTEALNDRKFSAWNQKDDEKTLLSTREVMSCNTPYDQSCVSKSSVKMKPKVIHSVKEAREYLSKKRDKGELDQGQRLGLLDEGADILDPAIDPESVRKTKLKICNENTMCESSIGEMSSCMPVADASGNSSLKKTELDGDDTRSILTKLDDSTDSEENFGVVDLRMPRTSQDYKSMDSNLETEQPIAEESWIQKNFHEFEPIVKKIGGGFKENYLIAKENVQDELNIDSDIKQLEFDEDDSELEWMKDAGLREIVFQVQENELAGRDPFHLMDAEDKLAFFKGLERKVEKENEKLLKLHEWVHARVENLDYGADGISLYDPPENIIPRWKGPPVDKDPEFLNNFVAQRKEFIGGNTGISNSMMMYTQDTLKKPEESSSHPDISTSSAIHDSREISQDGASTNSKTVIECSDGSVRAGKKSGKEYWQHTKKWSREFVDVYNEETDPEVKSIMKDMGKDLDRWITEKEIQEAADLMTNIPNRKRRYIEKKVNKLKREMEMFGPQAVVSKYREYAEEEEDDYLWWLDLPSVLCLELYIHEDGIQKIGFYSLEMASDLELDPKQYHVIAFEDKGDSKNFCYIVQAHMEMLGKGHAFIVARPPKDTFREAKANGFNVTVIRKGEIKLNVDQTLEEVEEQITEIGSKMYHDKITRERSVDMGSLMKGVFGASRNSKRRRSKRLLKKPEKRRG